MRAAGPIALAMILGGAVSAPAAAEQGPPGPAGFADQVSVGYVLVPVVARGRKGPLDDLAAEDFELSVDGQRVAIDAFERGAEAAVGLAVLQDLSGSMAYDGKLEASLEALGCLLERAGPDDRVALATFAGRRFDVEVPFTGDLATVREAAREWAPYGLTALHDAVVEVAGMAATRGGPNQVAVLVTDGIENASRLEPSAARELARRAEVPVYALGLTPLRASRQPPAGALRHYEALLRLLAESTGGRYFRVRDAADAVAACVEISTEIRTRYVLGFPTAAGGEPAFHRIRVEVAGRPAQVRHRRGYVGPPPR